VRGSHATHFVLIVGLLGVWSSNAAVFTEDFASPPAERGWRTFGDSSLFSWNSTNHTLEVTWDSARPNSYFFHSLGTILSKSDDFAFQFDLRLSSILPGVNPAKPSTFEIAVGLLRLASASDAAFSRGTGRDSPNLVEWDYFPAADIIEATVSPVIVSSNSQFIPGFTFPLEMPANELFHVALAYTASNRTLVTTMTRNGASFGPIQTVRLPGSFTDFRIDAFSISSYNDAGDESGSILARGAIDNVVVTTSAPPLERLDMRITNGLMRVRFAGRTNWIYTLERSTDLMNYNSIQTVILPASTNVVLEDAFSAAVTNRFYRVRADRP
jgi:hypothetical protein